MHLLGLVDFFSHDFSVGIVLKEFQMRVFDHGALNMKTTITYKNHAIYMFMLRYSWWSAAKNLSTWSRLGLRDRNVREAFFGKHSLSDKNSFVELYGTKEVETQRLFEIKSYCVNKVIYVNLNLHKYIECIFDGEFLNRH